MSYFRIRFFRLNKHESYNWYFDERGVYYQSIPINYLKSPAKFRLEVEFQNGNNFASGQEGLHVFQLSLSFPEIILGERSIGIGTFSFCHFHVTFVGVCHLTGCVSLVALSTQLGFPKCDRRYRPASDQRFDFFFPPLTRSVPRPNSRFYLVRVV